MEVTADARIPEVMCFLRELCIPTCKSIPINNVASSRAKPTEDMGSGSEVTRFFYVSYYFLR